MTHSGSGPSTLHRIFVVEDHELVRATLCELIESAPDLTVCGTASSVAGALRQVPELAPDLLLVDLSLGDGDGHTLIRQLRGERPELPAIIISGHPAATYREMSLHAGAADYVDKLEAPYTLIPTIYRILNASHLGDNS